ncbi:MAG: phosphatidylserine decarboxylase [Pyrinomonadaceae bacterium]
MVRRQGGVQLVMAKEGFPFVITPMIAAMLLAYLGIWWAAAILALLAGFMAFFFRDPYRNVPEEAGVVVAAADGRVTRIDRNDGGPTISVFLSPLDVHINRAPISGRITLVEYVKGRKGPATSNEASFTNERNSITIQDGQITVICTQIAGILARRIVCWKKQGDDVERGERFGLIKFGSRTDVKLPAGTTVAVEVGDRVTGGETIIARLPE